VLFAAEQRYCFVSHGKHAGRTLVQKLARGSQAVRPPARPIEKHGAGLVLELSERDADGRLGAGYAVSGSLDAVFFHNGYKHFQLHEFHVGLSLNFEFSWQKKGPLSSDGITAFGCYNLIVLGRHPLPMGVIIWRDITTRSSFTDETLRPSWLLDANGESGARKER
jgi:hypothetical protein